MTARECPWWQRIFISETSSQRSKDLSGRLCHQKSSVLSSTNKRCADFSVTPRSTTTMSRWQQDLGRSVCRSPKWPHAANSVSMQSPSKLSTISMWEGNSRSWSGVAMQTSLVDETVKRSESSSIFCFIGFDGTILSAKDISEPSWFLSVSQTSVSFQYCGAFVMSPSGVLVEDELPRSVKTPQGWVHQRSETWDLPSWGRPTLDNFFRSLTCSSKDCCSNVGESSSLSSLLLLARLRLLCCLTLRSDRTV